MGTNNFYKICPDCDYFCNEQEKKNYCPKCGKKLIDQCKRCGAKIDYPYGEFCPFCGKPYRNKKNNDDFKDIL